MSSTNKDLFYSTWNSVQCYVTAWRGEEFGGEWIYVYVWLSPFACPPKTITTLLISYTSKLKKFFFKIPVLNLIWKPSSDIFWWDQVNQTYRMCHNIWKDNRRGNGESLLPKVLHPRGVQRHRGWQCADNQDAHDMASEVRDCGEVSGTLLWLIELVLSVLRMFHDIW